MLKLNCYDCKYRGDLMGGAHSRCEHPSIGTTSPFDEVMGILASVGRVPPMLKSNELNIKGSTHGIKNGWFNWPYNFDPVWLENCDGFESKNKPLDNSKGGD